MMGRILDAAVAAGTVFGVQYLGRESSPAEDGSVKRWYRRLEKPGFSPPAPVYAVVWTVLDGLLAWSGYRLLRAGSSWGRTLALCLWALCVIGIAVFPAVVFGKRRLDTGLAVCIGLVMTSVTSIFVARKVDRCAARLQVPFFVWLVFAVFVQEEVWRRN